MSMKQWMTFGIKTEGADKAAKDIEKVADAAQDASKETENLNESFEDGVGALDRMTGGAITAFKGVRDGVKSAVVGMRTLKGAIAATGIGLLLVAVSSLVSFFTRTKRGAELLQVATASISVVFGKFADTLSLVGEFLVGLFENPLESLKNFGKFFLDQIVNRFVGFFELIPAIGRAIGLLFKGQFRAAGKVAADAVGKVALGVENVTDKAANLAKKGGEAFSKFTAEVRRAAEQAARLERRAIRLRDAERQLSVEFAQQRQEIAELKKAGDDITLSIEERIKATEEAAAIEQSLADERLRLAQEAVDIQRQQMSLTEATAEDLDRLAELEIALSEAQTESLGVQTELLTKVNGLYAEQEAKIKELEALELERFNTQLSIQERIDALLDGARAAETKRIIDQYNADKKIIEENGLFIVGLEEAKQKQLDAIRDKYAKIEEDRKKKERDDEIALQQSKIQAISNAFGALIALNESYASDDEEANKRVFQRNKNLSKGQAIINTYAAIADALAKDATFPGSRFIAAASAATLGFAQVRKINQTEYQSPTSTDDVINNPLNDDRGNLGNVTAPTLDLGFLGEGAVGSIQAFVISENVTNQQQADQLVADQTVL